MDDISPVPNDWDRSGLPGWTYFSENLLTVEREEIFRKHWQIACHVNDVPEPGDYTTFDIVDERAVIVRGHDREVRAFHNLCRHRGARVVGDASGHCNKAMICPYHGWAYNLDGTLRGVAERDSFPPMDRKDWGLKPIETEIWHGLVFIRFKGGDQPPVAELMARFEYEVSQYKLDKMVPTDAEAWEEDLQVNWKSIRDVDNEGYHVRQAHPGLHDLYGNDYFDEPYKHGTSRSLGRFNKGRAKKWSVNSYLNTLPKVEGLSDESQSAWLYIGIFPNQVVGFYPDSVIYYQELPVSATQTTQRGRSYRHAEEDRQMRLARYLSMRIDRDTMKEDQMLCKWSSEATKSSGFDRVMYSDLEYGLKTHHDHLAAKVPAIRTAVEPELAQLWPNTG
jgi:phenylpropionate dioxygenase-like ring-hydroxylating dioxygenase large terminal subunit